MMSTPRSVPTTAKRAARVELDVDHRRFQVLGRRLLALLDHRGGGQQDRLALRIEASARRRCRRRSGSRRSRPARCGCCSIGMPSSWLVIMRIGGLVALAGALRADQHLDRAVLGEAHLGALRRPAAGRLQIVGEADAAPLAAPLGLGLARGEAGPVGLRAAPRPAPSGSRRCRSAGRWRWCRAWRSAAPCCAGGSRRGRCRARAPRRRSAARPGSCSPAARRRDRRPPARCWSARRCTRAWIAWKS